MWWGVDGDEKGNFRRFLEMDFRFANTDGGEMRLFSHITNGQSGIKCYD